jgi:RNA-binding protein 39
MAKLAAGTGMKLPDIATQALNSSAMLTGAGQASSVASVAAAAQAVVQQQQQQLASMNPPIATQCFLLSNMFDPATETSPSWDMEIRDDVIDECSRHGGVLHIYVDKVMFLSKKFQLLLYIEYQHVSLIVINNNGNCFTESYCPLLTCL